ncbi:hypothetical protein B9T19_05085 [Ignatzschineria sp. F8392]|uniref:hypothetical protein n=1 Tax=Ignatzschineria sp. F8392 TaxID=1980117 RepID=UPI000B981140|nr:hypothetical protein [Ignatzschineria sp. F8392]OYQ80617.1 hypothetical protein B9T19_05085 [Ignatzschineria sp. F8392]
MKTEVLKTDKKRISSKEFTQRYMSAESQQRIQELTDQLDLEYSLILIERNRDIVAHPRSALSENNHSKQVERAFDRCFENNKEGLELLAKI